MSRARRPAPVRLNQPSGAKDATDMRPVKSGAHARAALSRIGATIEGARPMNAHKVPRITMGAVIETPHSVPRRAQSDRSDPRKTPPKTLTKHATASAPMRASAGAPKAPATHTRGETSSDERKRPK